MLTTKDVASADCMAAVPRRRSPRTKLQLAAAKLGLLLCRAPAACGHIVAALDTKQAKVYVQPCTVNDWCIAGDDLHKRVMLLHS
jgi:hypothetical protein